MISNILTWFEQEATLLQAIAAGTAILGFGGAVIWGGVPAHPLGGDKAQTGAGRSQSYIC